MQDREKGKEYRIISIKVGGGGSLTSLQVANVGKGVMRCTLYVVRDT
jgi:hypothetical protein